MAKLFEKNKKKWLTFVMVSDNIYFTVAKQRNKKKNKIKKLLTKANTHDNISELLLRKLATTNLDN